MALLPDKYQVLIDIDDSDIFKIGLAVYLGIIAWHILKKGK